MMDIEASFHKGSTECVPLEIFLIHSSKKTGRNDQVDWKFFNALETPMSALSEGQRTNEYLADVA